VVVITRSIAKGVASFVPCMQQRSGCVRRESRPGGRSLPASPPTTVQIRVFGISISQAQVPSFELPNHSSESLQTCAATWNRVNCEHSVLSDRTWRRLEVLMDSSASHLPTMALVRGRSSRATHQIQIQACHGFSGKLGASEEPVVSGTSCCHKKRG
jgi:hypothetical protein